MWHVDAGAEREFLEFVAGRQASLFKVAMLLTGHRQQAEDLLQSTLARVAQHWSRVRRVEHLDAYVRRVMYHEQVAWWRRLAGKREDATDRLPDRPAPGDEADRATLRLSVALALRELPIRQRTALVLRYFEDLPESQVATIMGCSVGTVRSHTARALTRLRERFPDLAVPTTHEAAL
jgi:RNA polymerase sigma-70 factor (sigma-E family)